MKNLKKIVWLASYPKSGNTWFRAFLTNLLNDIIEPADINQLMNTTIASSRELFDEISGIPSADLSLDEIDRLRFYVYKQMAIESKDTLFLKIHDGFAFSKNGNPLVPKEVTKAVLYIIRNPLDVAVSFAHHMSASIDDTIAIMNNTNYAFCNHNDRLSNQLRQKLFSWSYHVTSWVDSSGLPLLLIRYEDMINNALGTFSKAAYFIGIDKSLDNIQLAIENSSFDKLKNQEKEKGFIEKNINAASFFRKGEPDDWKKILSRDQINNIINAHKIVMKRFGYLPETDKAT